MTSPTASIRAYLSRIGRKGGRKGGLARGPNKARTTAQARKAGKAGAKARWIKAGLLQLDD